MNDYIKALRALRKFGETAKPSRFSGDLDKRSEKLTSQERESLPDSAFAAVYKDPKTGKKVRKYPIHDPDHVQNALERWPLFYKRLPPSQRAKAARKIYNAAKRFGKEVHEETILQYVRGSVSSKRAESILRRRHQITGDSAYLDLIKMAENKISVDTFIEKVAALDAKNRILPKLGQKVAEPEAAIEIPAENVRIDNMLIPIDKFRLAVEASGLDEDEKKSVMSLAETDPDGFWDTLPYDVQESIESALKAQP